MFLEVPEAVWVCANALAFAFRDRFPVSPGHTLVVTRRVTPDWFSATADEQRAVLALVDEVRRRLDDELAPDGYNVGFNAGSAAGQTVMHLHVHVIPRDWSRRWHGAIRRRAWRYRVRAQRSRAASEAAALDSCGRRACS